MRIFELSGQEPSEAAEAVHAALDPEAPEDYRQLASLLVVDWAARRPRAVGIAGGQGAGKSTLGALLERAGERVGLRICVLSLDDFYLERSERLALARAVHPLFETRGPPGTHDVALCRASLLRLRAESAADESDGRPLIVELPVFDKGRDDRAGKRGIEGPVDIVVLEGWCVGARPIGAAELGEPINDLEANEDPEGVWRGRVNAELAGDYARLWSCLDELVFLEVPTLDAVRRWRLHQERARPVDQRLSEDQIFRFVQHYERWTRSMSSDLSARADTVVSLDESHSIVAIRSNR